MAAVSGEGVFPISSCSGQREEPGTVPDPRASAVAAADTTTKPTKLLDLETIPGAPWGPAPRGLHPAPLPN
jgi:hypothetical protein